MEGLVVEDLDVAKLERKDVSGNTVCSKRRFEVK